MKDIKAQSAQELADLFAQLNGEQNKDYNLLVAVGNELLTRPELSDEGREHLEVMLPLFKPLLDFEPEA